MEFLEKFNDFMVLEVLAVLAGTSADTGRLSSDVSIENHDAMMEAQLVLATLVQCVTFELVSGQTIAPEPLITLCPRGGIRVVVRRR